METLEVIERCLRRPAIFSAGSGVRNDAAWPVVGIWFTPKAVNQMWDLFQYPLRLLLFRIQDLVQTFKQSIKQH